jgi:hypothetical protein
MAGRESPRAALGRAAELAARQAVPLLVRRGRRAVDAGRADGYLPVPVLQRAGATALRGPVAVARIVRPVDWDFQEQEGKRRVRRYVRTGSWDTSAASFDEDPRHTAIRDLVDADLRYRETRAYQAMLDDLAAGRPQYRHGALDSVAAIDRYWEDRVALVRSLQAEGYTSERPSSTAGIAIGRDGTLLKIWNGNHRFAIARCIGLATVPVSVRLVHADWCERALGSSNSHDALVAAVQACL